MQTGIYQNPLWYTQYPALSMFASFKDFQNVLAQKVARGNGTAAGEGWNCPYPCDYHVPTCFDVLPESPGQCYDNLMWAKNTGLDLHPEWYTGFPGLTVNSSVSDFQYVLHSKVVSGNGTGWQCPLPCTSTYLVPSTTAAPNFLAATTMTTSTSTTSTTTTIESSSALPWWCWLLLLLLAVLFCCVVAVAARAYILKTRSKQSPKKKRAAREEKEALTDQTDVSQQSVEAETNSTQFLTKQPFQPALPTMTNAVPAYPVAGAFAAQNLFDRIDLNHDGVITRDEYARLNLFDQLDTNHDGVLTREEYARLR